jgi:hypothetical protein
MPDSALLVCTRRRFQAFQEWEGSTMVLIMLAFEVSSFAVCLFLIRRP